MGVERFARKSFGFVVVLLLGLAIYFQAAGTVELVASSAFAAATKICWNWRSAIASFS